MEYLKSGDYQLKSKKFAATLSRAHTHTHTHVTDGWHIGVLISSLTGAFRFELSVWIRHTVLPWPAGLGGAFQMERPSLETNDEPSGYGDISPSLRLLILERTTRCLVCQAREDVLPGRNKKIKSLFPPCLSERRCEFRTLFHSGSKSGAYFAWKTMCRESQYFTVN